MLRSLPYERIVVAISYGCIGRSRSVARTASANGLATLRRLPIIGPHLPYPVPSLIRSRLLSGPVSYPVPSLIRAHLLSGPISYPGPYILRAHLLSGPISYPAPY